MIVRIVNPSDKFKNNFDKAANKAAKEVHKLMKEKEMKSIEKAPKDIQQIFEEIWKEFLKTETNRFPYQVCGDFFLKGFDTAMALGGFPQRPKRIISEVSFSPQGLILAKSNDGKLFMIKGFNEHGQPQWLPYPDLPQD